MKLVQGTYIKTDRFQRLTNDGNFFIVISMASTQDALTFLFSESIRLLFKNERGNAEEGNGK